jgi:(1->4)-alpha-D-glucan 1-alpha-D-glucosylmutase
MTCPGTPDFYQGAELWEFRMVDPDNRRPVDYAKRQKMLDRLQNLDPAKARTLLENLSDGSAKLYLISRTLKTRKRRSEIFSEGAYIPLTTKGTFGNHVVAFCRKKREDYVLVVVPRFLAAMNGDGGGLPLGEIWGDTAVFLPEKAPKNWTEVLSGNTVSSKQTAGKNALSVADVLRGFPAALLMPGE